MELSADPKGKAEGVVIESKIEQGRGPVTRFWFNLEPLKRRLTRCG